jgi:hypothetical protein
MSGILMGPECIVIKAKAGGAVAERDLVHIEADGFWDKTAATDTGKFGVALDAAAAEGDPIRVCIWGRCTVKASAAAIAKGAYVIADAGVVKAAGTIDATTPVGSIVGTTMEEFASGEAKTVWIGLVG